VLHKDEMQADCDDNFIPQSGIYVYVTIWDWDLIVIRSFEIRIHCSDLGLGFRFQSRDLGCVSKI